MIFVPETRKINKLTTKMLWKESKALYQKPTGRAKRGTQKPEASPRKKSAD